MSTMHDEHDVFAILPCFHRDHRVIVTIVMKPCSEMQRDSES
jgi:hypothetical protein